MELKDYAEFAEDPLRFPINGQVFEAPPIGAKLGILLMRGIEGDRKARAELARGKTLWEKVLGPTYQKMVTADVPMPAIGRAGFAALVDFQYGREAAVAAWETGLDPEALAARAAAIQEKMKASQPSPTTDEASTTPSPASTSGTSSPPASGKKKRANRSASSH